MQLYDAIEEARRSVMDGDDGSDGDGESLFADEEEEAAAAQALTPHAHEPSQSSNQLHKTPKTKISQKEAKKNLGKRPIGPSGKFM